MADEFKALVVTLAAALAWGWAAAEVYAHAIAALH